jgi:6,7-dimethyl-8-ribityllumazine synthase
VSGAGRPALETVNAPELTLAILGTRWHADITDSLIERAAAAAVACGIDDPLVLRVAGAVELPVVAAELARYHDAALRVRLRRRHPGADPGGPGRRHSRGQRGTDL